MLWAYLDSSLENVLELGVDWVVVVGGFDLGV